MQIRDYVTKEATAAWLAFLNAMPCPVVNRPIPAADPRSLSGSPLLSQLASGSWVSASCLPLYVKPSRRDPAVFKAWSERPISSRSGRLNRGMFCTPMMASNRSVVSWSSRRSRCKPSRTGSGLTVYVVGEEVVATVLQPSEDVPQRMEMPSVLSERCLGLVGDWD